MTSALLYLRFTSLVNLVLHRIRRLKQPKYVMGTVAAIAYFYFFVGRRFGQAMASSGPMMPQTMATFATMGICVLLTTVGLLRLAFAWARAARALETSCCLVWGRVLVRAVARAASICRT